jgi:hypothetical protein
VATEDKNLRIVWVNDRPTIDALAEWAGQLEATMYQSPLFR